MRPHLRDTLRRMFVTASTSDTALVTLAASHVSSLRPRIRVSSASHGTRPRGVQQYMVLAAIGLLAGIRSCSIFLMKNLAQPLPVLELRTTGSDRCWHLCWVALSLSVSTWKERRSCSSAHRLRTFSVPRPCSASTSQAWEDLLASSRKAHAWTVCAFATELAVLSMRTDGHCREVDLERYDLLQEGEWAAMAGGPPHSRLRWILKLSKRLAGRACFRRSSNLSPTLCGQPGQAGTRVLTESRRALPACPDGRANDAILHHIGVMRFGIVAEIVGGIKAFGLLAASCMSPSF